MLQAPFLQAGDTIGIVAPARKISKAEIQPAVELITKWGFKVKLGAHLFNEYNQFAGTDEQRIADFQEMIDDTEVKAILCGRGGYGSIRLLEGIDFSRLKSNPKWIVGYSDITAFHSHLHMQGQCSLHATMPINFPNNAEDNVSTQTLLELLTGNQLTYQGDGHEFNKDGKANGILVGGNLSMLYSLRGTPYDVDTKGKILFIEDLDEYLYHIDRMMMNLKTGGKLANLKGLIVGGMSDMNDNTIPFGKTAKEIIAEAVSEYDFPVIFDFPAGHQDNNVAMMLGAEIEMEVSASGYEINYL